MTQVWVGLGLCDLSLAGLGILCCHWAIFWKCISSASVVLTWSLFVCRPSAPNPARRRRRRRRRSSLPEIGSISALLKSCILQAHRKWLFHVIFHDFEVMPILNCHCFSSTNGLNMTPKMVMLPPGHTMQNDVFAHYSRDSCLIHTHTHTHTHTHACIHTQSTQ